MPKLGDDLFGYSIFCWSNENDPLEPLHVHIAKKPRKNATKIWILSDGTTRVESNGSNIPSDELKLICRAIERNPFSYVARWEKHFQTKATFIDEKI